MTFNEIMAKATDDKLSVRRDADCCLFIEGENSHELASVGIYGCSQDEIPYAMADAIRFANAPRLHREREMLRDCVLFLMDAGKMAHEVTRKVLARIEAADAEAAKEFNQ